MAEPLSFGKRVKAINDLKEQFESTPNLTIYDVDERVALKSTDLGRKYGFRLPDAIQLATAINAKANVFITNNTRLKKCEDIKVVVI